MLRTLLLCVALITPLAAHAQRVTYENGDVLIGTAASGDELDRAETPDRQLLVAIDSPYQVFAEAGTFIHVAAWTVDGTPARGARVYLSGHLVGRTDETGTLAFRWGVPGNDVEAYWLNGSDIAVRWDHDGNTYGGQVWFSAFSRTQSFESDHLFVYTDRGVYNPGQAIHIRTIGWHLATDYTPVEGAAIDFLLNSPDYTPVAGGQATTDRFGTAALDLELSEQLEEGLYELVASYNGATATARLRVERFVAPVIEIDHTLGRFLTRDQEELAFDVSLRYFAGGEFQGGTIAVDLLVDGASRFHTESDVAGAGPHPFLIPEDELDDIRDDLYEGQPIQVQIAVTDSYGRQDDLSRDMTYTANPYIAIIEKDRDYYSTGDPVELIVRLTDVERVPVRDTEVRLTSTCHDDQTARTDSGGTAQFSLVMPDHECMVEVYLAGVETPLATNWLAWLEAPPMRSHIADAIVEENAPVHVTLRFPSHYEPAEAVVHMDVVDTSGSLVNSVLIPIRREGDAWIAEGTFTAPSWGSMLLTFFCLARSTAGMSETPEGWSSLGLMTEGQNLAVHPGRELEILLDGVPDELAPGGDWTGQVRVVDGQGNPVDAVVGAAVVDGAVISLKDPLEITPMDHFYNPELRVISTTGSAILTWPVVSRNWGDRFMDIALPPFPYNGAGPVGVGWGSYGYGSGEAMAYDGYYDGPTADAAGPPSEPMMLMEAEMEVEELASAQMQEGQNIDMATVSRGLGVAIETPPPPVTITIRTQFPETSLWAPHLYTEGGATQIAGTMPDAITEQEIALVASDRNGGAGLLRRRVRVTQPLYVQSDLPDALVVGDRLDARVAVQNLTDVPVTVEVELAGDFSIAGATVQTLELPAQGTGMATFAVTANRPGRVDYRVTARSADRVDEEQRTAWVRPAGTPHVSMLDGVVLAGAPWTATLAVPSEGQLTTSALSVAFPAISAAFAGLDAVRHELRTGDTMAMGGEIIATALLYDFQRTHGVAEAELADVRAMLDAVIFELIAAQRPDGGWGFWWDAESSPYITAYCLEALITLHGIGLMPAELAVRVSAAGAYLARERDGQTYDQSAIAFWEGNTDVVRLGLTAEIFSIMASMDPSTRPGEWTAAMSEMASYFREYLDHDSPDVLTYAHAVLGLHRLTGSGVATADRERLLVAARRLSDLRRDGHWEPSWFNAYGGTVEATLAALQVFHELGEEMPAVEVRDAVRYILSTRDEWGGWHNPRGTAAAIRALLILGPGAEEVASEVVVTVDGAEVSRVAIDPADPFMSAMALRQLDLTPWMGPGDHRVEVSYTGRLEPQIRLIQRHWGAAEDAPAGLVSLEGNLGTTAAGIGQPVDFSLRVASQSNSSRMVRVDVAAPANAEIDRLSVQALRDSGLVEGVEWIDGALRLYLALGPEADRELALRWMTVRPGEAAVPSATATVLSGPGREQATLTGYDFGTTLVVH